jgi:hypothetical protein
MKKKKVKKPKLGIEVALVSQRNRVFTNKKKEENKMLCRKKKNE